jgi:hypothetical protein
MRIILRGYHLSQLISPAHKVLFFRLHTSLRKHYKSSTDRHKQPSRHKPSYLPHLHSRNTDYTSSAQSPTFRVISQNIHPDAAYSLLLFNRRHWLERKGRDGAVVDSTGILKLLILGLVLTDWLWKL